MNLDAFLFSERRSVNGLCGERHALVRSVEYADRVGFGVFNPVENQFDILSFFDKVFFHANGGYSQQLIQIHPFVEDSKFTIPVAWFVSFDFQYIKNLVSLHARKSVVRNRNIVCPRCQFDRVVFHVPQIDDAVVSFNPDQPSVHIVWLNAVRQNE